MTTLSDEFVNGTPEKAEFNQYWYSSHTIKTLVKELLSSSTRVAFLSTPSVYFSLPEGSEVQRSSWLFDLDEQWSQLPAFCKFDFQQPEAIPARLHHSFDAVVIDPPFITHEVWAKYAQAAQLLLKEGGKVIASTVAENKELLQELLGCQPCAFKPSVPHLIYQYNFFTNYPTTQLDKPNPEIPEDE